MNWSGYRARANYIKIGTLPNFPDYKDISIKRIENEYIQSLINILTLNSGYTEGMIKTEIDRCLNILIE